MGKGNVCVFGEYEGLFYVDWENFYHWDSQNDVPDDLDYAMAHDAWEESKEQFVLDFCTRFKSFSLCDEWTNNNERAIAENELFYITVEDNEWSMAIKLIQKEQHYSMRGNIENLQKRYHLIYLEGMKECLFNQFDELGTYRGSWTSGRITKN